MKMADDDKTTAMSKTDDVNSDNIITGEVEKLAAQKGETQDDLDLIELTGHTPVLERNYSRFALLAMSFMVVDSFMGIVGSLAAGINSGGTVSSPKIKASFITHFFFNIIGRAYLWFYRRGIFFTDRCIIPC